MSIWDRPEAFEPARGRVRTLLGTLAHRRSVDVVRCEEARRRRVARDAATVTPIPDVDELAMAIVAADQRDAIELAYFGGRTYRQVADELGIPEGTAKSRMRLGLSRIAHALEAQGVDLAWT